MGIIFQHDAVPNLIIKFQKSPCLLIFFINSDFSDVPRVAIQIIKEIKGKKE